jgi:hypothetical protein
MRQMIANIVCLFVMIHLTPSLDIHGARTARCIYLYSRRVSQITTTSSGVSSTSQIEWVKLYLSGVTWMTSGRPLSGRAAATTRVRESGRTSTQAAGVRAVDDDRSA